MTRPTRNTLFEVFLCLALTAYYSCQAKAQDRTVFGAGMVSCAEWQQARIGDKSNAYQAEAWVDGYLSGSNTSTDGPDFLSNKPKSIALYAWIDNYCATHPLDAVITAAWRLKKELLSRAR